MKTKNRTAAAPVPKTVGRIRLIDAFKYVVPKPRGLFRAGPRIKRNSRGGR